MHFNKFQLGLIRQFQFVSPCNHDHQRHSSLLERFSLHNNYLLQSWVIGLFAAN